MLERERNRRAVILHVQPVAHLQPIAVDRQRLAQQDIDQRERDQLFRETGKVRSCSSNW